jgi:uncharacterized repeat protein (TIGR03803 family)
MRTPIHASSALVAAALLLPLASHAATFKTLYAFGNASDGANPVGGLIAVGRYLYGTTSGGGTSNFGTVFKVNRKTGAQTVVYNFAGIPDGRQPFAALINIQGTLYGTTYLGGAGSYPSGTVFSINPATGAETVLHSFSGGSGGSDGGDPAAAMINVGGILYGTTQIGGATNSGTVFMVNPATGAETILYTFDANNGGGYAPGGLLNVHGTIYGIVGVGGGTGCGGDGCGAVFKIDPNTGAESLVHAFGGGSDGASPASGALINLHGTVYGTTTQGGGTGCGLQVGCGTLFSLDPGTGAETVIYAFAGGSDGASPDSVVNLHGTLYGATAQGGGTGCSVGCGTIFSVTPRSGAEAVLYAFTGGNDGSNPVGRLITKRGLLYGETYTGASNYGTVFKLTP